MGQAASRPVREAPVRYVAQKMPKVDKVPIEKQFKKPSFTAQGINTRQDDVNTEPIMYVETSKDASSTELTDHTAPRWYLNTYMEMLDNLRTDKTIISGNLPISWERDKFEPYSLVRGRIDDEDLRWILAPEQRKKGVDELLEHTKLDRQVLQDILDTVEVPRVQYRNYKGKLHKTIEDANTHMAARKVQVEKARESELLRRIGYSEEEVQKDEQYITKRTRGVKVLDDLGVSTRHKERQARADAANEMEEMLERRRIEQIENGEANITEEDLHSRPAYLSSKLKHYELRQRDTRKMYNADIGRQEQDGVKLQWWMDRRRNVRRAVDKIHGVPIYNERLSANEEQLANQMKEAAAFNMSLSRAQGAKGFVDPRSNFDTVMDMMRLNQHKDGANQTNVEVHQDDIGDHPVFRFPHTKSHPSYRKVTEVKQQPDDNDNFSNGAATQSSSLPARPAAASPAKGTTDGAHNSTSATEKDATAAAAPFQQPTTEQRARDGERPSDASPERNPQDK